MTETPFQWRDPSHPVYLHYNHEKFWEIKFNDSQRIQVRYGKLNNDGTEGSSEIHLIKKDTVEHAQDLITTKLKKGYQIIQKEKSMKSKQPNNVMQIEESFDDLILDSSQLRLNSQSQRETSSLKRRTSENLLHEDRKKVHMNELLQEEKAEQKNIMNSITSSLFGKKNGEQQQQTSLFRNNHQEEYKEKIPETILIEEDDGFPKSNNNNNKKTAQEILPSSRFDPFSFTDSGSEHSKKSDESIYDHDKYQKKFVSKNNSRANSEVSNRAVVNKEQPKPAQNKLSQEINNKSNRLDPTIFEENSYLLKPDSHSTFNTKSKPSSRSPTENNEITPMQVEESSTQSQPLEINTFQGDYLTKVINRKLQYCKVQVLYKYVKVEHAVVGNPRPTDVQLLTYKNTAAAEAMARQIIFNKTLSGYEPRSEKFVYDFKLAELGIKDISSIRTTKSKPIQQINKPKIDVKQLLKEDKEDKEDWESPVYELEVEDSLALFAKSSKQKPRTPVRDTPARRDPGLLFDVYDYDDINDENFSPDYGVDEPDEEYTRKEGKKSRPKQQKNSLSPERRELSTTTSRKHTLGESVKDYQALMEPSLWSKQNVKGWYLSEKLEGVRCFWSGEDLWNSVSKLIILTPEFFTKDFPKSPLDGVLWAGKGRMKELANALRRPIPDQHEWKGLVFKVLDAPMLKEPYKTRYEKMKAVFGEMKSQYISLHRQAVYKGEEDMKKIEDKLESEAILGVVLKDPNSYYEKGKSKSLLKLDKNDLLMKDIGSKLGMK